MPEATRPRPWVRRLAIAGTIAILGVAFVWWVTPANQIARQFRAIDMPASLHLSHEEKAYGWICFDDCPTGYRYWVSDLSQEATVEAVVAALRDSGATVDGELCTGAFGENCHYGGGYADWLISDVHWQGGVERRGVGGHVTIGRRVDGRVGVEIWFEVG